jgi:hypothetical protein
VPSRLSTVPARSRRHIAGALGLFAVLFIAVGSVAATQANTAALQAFVAVALVVALLFALLSWGFAYSIKIDESDAALADAVDRVLAQRPASLCSCGHEHDPDEMHTTGPAGTQDGTGTDGTHDCAHDCADDCAHDCADCPLR